MAKKQKQSILKKELSTKEVLLVVLVFTLLFAYGCLLIYPKYTEYKSSKSSLESLKIELDESLQRVSKIGILQEELKNLESRVAIKSKTINHKMDDGMFLIGLDREMKNEGVELISLVTDKELDYEEFSAIPIDMEFRGDYVSVREIFKYLQNQKNVTQILDYDIENYIDEVSQETNTTTESNLVIDDIVYWTNEGDTYHKNTCEILAGRDNVTQGTNTDTDKAPCEVCKPYTINKNEVVNEVQEPIAEGDVIARIKFIVYTSKDAKIELENGNPENWEPGKFNPFDSTVK